MTLDDTTVDLVRNALLITLKVGAPILVAGMAVGLVISLLQSVTSIQDQTLSTVPKIVVMIGATAVLLPWLAQRLVQYTAELLTLN